MSAEDTIKQTVTENDVVLFMKGTKKMPQCGF
jgi:monothiol glutaredoxin